MTSSESRLREAEERIEAIRGSIAETTLVKRVDQPINDALEQHRRILEQSDTQRFLLDEVAAFVKSASAQLGLPCSGTRARDEAFRLLDLTDGSGDGFTALSIELAESGAGALDTALVQVAETMKQQQRQAYCRSKLTRLLGPACRQLKEAMVHVLQARHRHRWPPPLVQWPAALLVCELETLLEMDVRVAEAVDDELRGRMTQQFGHSPDGL